MLSNVLELTVPNRGEGGREGGESSAVERVYMRGFNKYK